MHVLYSWTTITCELRPLLLQNFAKTEKFKKIVLVLNILCTVRPMEIILRKTSFDSASCTLFFFTAEHNPKVFSVGCFPTVRINKSIETA